MIMAKEKLIGVYQIKNIVNSKIYIGSSIDIHTRWKQHLNKLNKNSHTNEHLQNAWNKYGKDNFEFKIVELCDENILREKEQFYINKFNCTDDNLGYNIMPTTDMSMLSDETKSKISNTLKGKYVGENCFYSKLTEQQVKNIINDLIDGKLSNTEISKKYDVNKSVVSSIKSGHSWKYLTKDICFPSTKGRRNGLNKLTDENIVDVIECINNGFSDTEIGNKFGVNRKTISDIRNHKTWTKYTKDLVFQKSNGRLRGEKNNNSKLTLNQVKEIKNQILSDCMSLTAIANTYDVSVQTISHIKNNKVYTYV